MNNIFAIEDRKHRETLARVRIFRERFTTAVLVEPEPERETPPEGIVYSRATSKLSRPEVIRRIVEAKIPTPEPGTVQQALYPKESA